LEQHLDRLAHSAAALQFPLPSVLGDLIKRVLAAAGVGDLVLRVICTRGTEAGLGPTSFAIASEIPADFAVKRARGLHVVLLSMAVDPLVRAASPWLLPGVKSTSYAVNMATTRAAQTRGADEAVFVGLGGELLEGPTSNVWWRVGQTLLTPSLELGIL